MNLDAQKIQEQFEQAGAEFLSPGLLIEKKLSKIKAFVFDWDGVFNNAQKNENGSSNFNEADSMGTNLLRFSYYTKNQVLPQTAIISGEKNQQSFFFSKREHFNNCYYKVGNKIIAFKHLCVENNLQPEEVCYFFDDVLDLSIAKICGLRILINRNAGVLFKQYVRHHELADYITANEGGNYAIREACEMLMGINGTIVDVINQRTDYSATYAAYLQARNVPETNYYTLTNGEIKQDQSIL